MILTTVMMRQVGILVDAGRGAAMALGDSNDGSQDPGAAVNSLVMSLPLLVTNVLATLLIGYKAK
jgi:hypothetical protein